GQRGGPRPPSGGVAIDFVAQWETASSLGAIRGGPRHTGPCVASGPTRARSLVAVRGRSRTGRAHQVLLRPSAAAYLGARVGGSRAPALGDRTAVSGTQVRTGARSFRGTDISRLAASCRLDGC